LAGEAAAEDIDVWHRHGQRSICTATARLLTDSRPIAWRIAMKASGDRPVSCATGVGHKGAHVGMARDTGPMPGKDPPAVLVLLALPHNAHPGTLEAEIESADPAEK
jgi:hypothetical protein